MPATHAAENMNETPIEARLREQLTVDLRDQLEAVRAIRRMMIERAAAAEVIGELLAALERLTDAALDTIAFGAVAAHLDTATDEARAALKKARSK
jgi:hypothetical protein